jgi:hypothetical protein
MDPLQHFIAGRVAKSTQHNCFYHFTDRKNLDSIRERGLLCTAELKRQKLFPQVTPGGDQNSLHSDEANGTDKYVCLCFTNNHPMCYVASSNRGLDAVYLRIRPEILKVNGVMITNAPSNQTGVQKVLAAAALSNLDLDVIYTRLDWTDPAVNGRLQIAEKYEILVPQRVTIDYISGGL